MILADYCRVGLLVQIAISCLAITRVARLRQPWMDLLFTGELWAAISYWLKSVVIGMFIFSYWGTPLTLMFYIAVTAFTIGDYGHLSWGSLSLEHSLESFNPWKRPGAYIVIAYVLKVLTIALFVFYDWHYHTLNVVSTITILFFLVDDIGLFIHLYPALAEKLVIDLSKERVT